MNAAGTSLPQRRPVPGMADQTNPTLHRFAGIIQDQYPGLDYVRVKRIGGRRSDRLYVTVRTRNTPNGSSLKAIVHGYGLCNLLRNLGRRIDAQPDLLAALAATAIIQ